jgi:7-carboxy-7-deazaguanine synthase (Cx14CxxC type)
MNRYVVKEIFLSLHGEGFHAGRKAVFCRFAGCNLWSGLEVNRGEGGSCSSWCDTDFVGTNGANGGRYTAAELATKAAELWGADREFRWVVLTGGEPTLQADSLLIDTLHRFGFQVAIETNGTKATPDGIDWVTLSPKAGARLVQQWCHEVKVVVPQADIDLDLLVGLSTGNRYFVQPMDGPEREANTQAAIAYCLDHPRWRLSSQQHKTWGLQ